ncbi:motility protein B [Trinickia violacea]|uniref:Motility protein B n=1 Tax=Trinickia violacea TaxID=2571746 RepID=A0A4P8J1Q5_9BURK|nr:OmpA family protein [Trinickia violacea]QCP54756.1 motility protein B [Trinickia violacea]
MNARTDIRRLASEKDDLHQDEGTAGGTERWLISYSDLITTLMVLFLALYALELAKYRQLETTVETQRIVKVAKSVENADPASGKKEAAKKALLSLLGALRDQKQLTLSENAQGVEIGIDAKVLFHSGDAHLLPDSMDVLSQVATVLKHYSSSNILVEGHSDNVPIATEKYESNWELSSARAGAVVRFLVDKGIEPHRLAAIGRADTIPLVIGDDEAARAANRRVTILVQY